jgi:hypothetical protein
MFLAATTYQLPDLKSPAKQKYEVAMIWFWDSEEFVESVKLLWSNTMNVEEELKDSVTKVVFENFERLQRREVFMALVKERRLEYSAGKNL